MVRLLVYVGLGGVLDPLRRRITRKRNHLVIEKENVRHTVFIPLRLQLQTRLLTQQDQHVPVEEISVSHGKKQTNRKKGKIIKRQNCVMWFV